MATGFNVIKFVMIDFDKGWNRTMLVTDYANILYTATASGAGLSVVWEGATGVMMTYRYQLEEGDEIFVVDQVVHIPSRCQLQEPGNTIECAR